MYWREDEKTVKMEVGLYTFLFCCLVHSLAIIPTEASHLDPFSESFSMLTSSKHFHGHRGRRSMSNPTPCNDADLPQPTYDYPVVLFEHLNYNECNQSSGKYIRIQAEEYIQWARNKSPPQRGKVMIWNSMIIYPGLNVTFRGCCPSGNNWVSIVSNWTVKSTDINATLYRDPLLRGHHGIWYERWLYWEMAFHLKISQPQDKTAIQNYKHGPK